MYLIQIGDVIFNPEQVVRIWRDDDADGQTIRILLAFGEPLIFTGAEARAFLGYATPAIHRLDAAEPPREQAPGVVILPGDFPEKRKQANEN